MKENAERCQLLCTCHRLPQGADVGEYWDFMGTLQQIEYPTLGENVGTSLLFN